MDLCTTLHVLLEPSSTTCYRNSELPLYIPDLNALSYITNQTSGEGYYYSYIIAVAIPILLYQYQIRTSHRSKQMKESRLLTLTTPAAQLVFTAPDT